MTVTFNDFTTEYPEFSEAGELMVQSRLDQAARETPEGVWGNFTDKGIMLRAADSLARGPSGSNADVDPDKETSYSVELKRWIVIVSAGRDRVI